MDRAEFEDTFPSPQAEGVTHLYKFLAPNPIKLLDILVRGRLYHPTPAQLNDPWELQGVMRLPEDPEGLAAARQRLVVGMLERGINLEAATRRTDELLEERRELSSILLSTIKRANRDIRLCSFTSKWQHNLLWAHYAESHKGLCLEFAANEFPFVLSYKIDYQEDFPEIVYPHDNYDVLTTVLTKSDEWDYEGEYRTFEVPGSNMGLGLVDGCVNLPPNALTGVYFGALAGKRFKSRVLAMIERGPFSPQVYTVELSNESYKLREEALHPLPMRYLEGVYWFFADLLKVATAKVRLAMKHF